MGESSDMVWFFERGSDSVHIETRYVDDSREYVLVMYWPDGVEKVERFGDSSSFRRRLEAIEEQLQREQWRPRGHYALRDGWKLT
jgi:hypothetical protein